ncbi:hypothetical protein AK972_1221 [Pseudomonas yamanorum]|nr:hypothetical protein AK972_1221 [Pseudomonas yamanorum]
MAVEHGGSPFIFPTPTRAHSIHGLNLDRRPLWGNLSETLYMPSVINGSG